MKNVISKEHKMARTMGLESTTSGVTDRAMFRGELQQPRPPQTDEPGGSTAGM